MQCRLLVIRIYLFNFRYFRFSVDYLVFVWIDCQVRISPSFCSDHRYTFSLVLENSKLPLQWMLWSYGESKITEKDLLFSHINLGLLFVVESCHHFVEKVPFWLLVSYGEVWEICLNLLSADIFEMFLNKLFHLLAKGG